jgi:hypothetical protein
LHPIASASSTCISSHIESNNVDYGSVFGTQCQICQTHFLATELLCHTVSNSLKLEYLNIQTPPRTVSFLHTLSPTNRLQCPQSLLCLHSQSSHLQDIHIYIALVAYLLPCVQFPTHTSHRSTHFLQHSTIPLLPCTSTNSKSLKLSSCSSLPSSLPAI